MKKYLLNTRGIAFMLLITVSLLSFTSAFAAADHARPALRVDQLPEAVAITGRNNDRFENALPIEAGVLYTEEALTSNIGFNSDAGWNTATQWYSFVAKETGTYTLFVTRDVREDKSIYFNMSFREDNRDVIIRDRSQYGAQVAGVITADLAAWKTYYITITSPLYHSKYPYIFTLCSPSAHAALGEFAVLQEADCIHDGCMGQSCTYCGMSANVSVIPANGTHRPGNPIELSAPTCTESGLQQIMCAVCGEILNVTEIPPTGHDFGEWSIGKMPTAEEAGYQIRTCRTCGESEVKELILTR